MPSRGLRSLLQPLLYAGIAALLHGLLFLIPMGIGSGKPDSRTTRGIRIRAVVDTPPSPRSGSVRQEEPTSVKTPPAGQSSRDTGGGNTPKPPGPEGGGPGAPGGDPVTGGPTQSEYGQYLARLRSEGVQGWARESSKSIRQGWKGTGSGTGSGGGWGTGGGGKGGSGGQGSGGAGYLDPRVRMVVTSYPSTGIEKRFTPVSYPEIKVKKTEYTSGWWNVYIEIRTDADGKIVKVDVLRPETNGALEKLFVEQVRKEIARWSFDPVTAEIHVDVRFYVE